VVGLSVMIMRSAEAADSYAMWGMDSGGPRKRVLDRGAHCTWRRLVNMTEPSTCSGIVCSLSNDFDQLYRFLVISGCDESRGWCCVCQTDRLCGKQFAGCWHLCIQQVDVELVRVG